MTLNFLILRTMPDPQDDHLIADNPIPQHVGPYRRHLAPFLASITAAVWELGEAIRYFDQPLGQSSCRIGIEGRNVGEDRLDVPDSIVGPDDPQASVADARALRRCADGPRHQPAPYCLMADKAAFTDIGVGMRVRNSLDGRVALIQQGLLSRH